MPHNGKGYQKADKHSFSLSGFDIKSKYTKSQKIKYRNIN